MHLCSPAGLRKQGYVYSTGARRVGSYCALGCSVRSSSDNELCMCCSVAAEEEDDMMMEWFQLVNEKNELVRRETDLVYM